MRKDPMTVRDAGQDAGDLIARAPGLMIPMTGRLSDEDFEKVRKYTDPRANITPDDYYSFRLIASSDGLDSYFTRQDVNTSLQNFAQDLAAGQSILGSHQTNTFSYGTSYDGEVSDADPSRAEYEATFYRKHAKIEKFRAKHWTVGKYAIPRGITLQGQSTDDLIRGIQLGAQRRVSISFTVGEYQCGIDGEDMMAGFFGLEGSGNCEHFPGIEYGEDGLATAIMRDGDLHETSLVFKNSSPGAMFLRKAEELAFRGILPSAAVAQLEERLMMRLPRYVSPVYAGVSLPERQAADGSSNKERSMGDKARHPDPEVPVTPPEEGTESTEAEGTKPVETPEIAVAPVIEGESEKEVEAGKDDGAAETAETEDRAPATGEQRHKGHSHGGPDKGGHVKATKEDEADEAAGEDAGEDGDDVAASTASSRAVELPALDSSLAVQQARWAAIAEAFGGEPTPDAVRQLQADAKLGNELFALEVDRAVKARVAVQGEKFDEPKYRGILTATRDLAFVQSEQASYSAQSGQMFQVGRQVKPAPVAERSEGAQAAPRDPRSVTPNPKGDGHNLVEGLITPKQH